jgi:zeaxanthin glucosyltransferase
MAEILVAMRPRELGHLHCSFALMNDVQQFGHTVTYMAIPEDETIVRQQGFNFRLLSESLQPNDFKCDLFVADQALPTAALQATYHGYQSIILSTTLPEPPGYPPSWSSRIPTRTFSSGLAAKAEGIMDTIFVRQLRSWRDLSSGKRDLWGVNARAIPFDLRFVSALKRLKSLPTLIACPSELQFISAQTAADRKNWIFIDPCVDYKRSLDHFDCDVFHRGSVKICAALGSQATKLGTRVSKLLIDVLRRRPDWSMVLSTSGSLPDLDIGTIPENVVTLKAIPQMAALAQSDILVTHCGLNSVKEAISMGVPMVGIPIWRDQPSIGARIRHHGLGMTAKARTVDSLGLEILIEKTLASKKVSTNVEQMQAIFRKSAEQRIGARIMDQMIRSARAA